jgi:hypothetical protein
MTTFIGIVAAEAPLSGVGRGRVSFVGKGGSRVRSRADIEAISTSRLRHDPDMITTIAASRAARAQGIAPAAL